MFRPIARVTVIPLALAVLTVLSLFASVPGQEQAPSAETAAAEPQNAPVAAAVSFYVSPNKLVHTQLAEKILHSPQWSLFFTRHLTRLNSRWLSDSSSPLADVDIGEALGMLAEEATGSMPSGIYYFTDRGGF
ncbi:MAG: hypothetical protein J6S75_05315 [Thermoguttaceae bacterium]|nr:hypothetical protein [Thermoguttaceae bacterium]